MVRTHIIRADARDALPCAAPAPAAAPLSLRPPLQDPVLFSGTLRSNLDPWDQHDDAALWSVLADVQLKGAIRAAGGLHVRMAEAGDNLSVGQRQLFCLARCAHIHTRRS